jgi:hypothetical protein
MSTAIKSKSDHTNIVFAEPRNENQALRSKRHQIVNTKQVANKSSDGRLFDLISTNKLKMRAMNATGKWEYNKSPIGIWLIKKS